MARNALRLRLRAIFLELFLLSLFFNPTKCANQTITFSATNLNVTVDLLLLFNVPPNSGGGPLVKASSVAWEVLSVGNGIFARSFNINTGFFIPEISSTNIVSGVNYLSCNSGQQCDAETDSTGSEVITNLTSWSNNTAIKCTNLNQHAQDIGIAFKSPGGTNINPVLIWQNVSTGYAVTAAFTPQLQFYATPQYQQYEIITGDINSPLLLSVDLSGGGNFSYSVSIDPVTLDVVLTPSTNNTTRTTTATTITTTRSTTSNPAPSSSATASRYGQCGGIGYTGPTICVSPYTCTYSSVYYYQCL